MTRILVNRPCSFRAASSCSIHPVLGVVVAITLYSSINENTGYEYRASPYFAQGGPSSADPATHLFTTSCPDSAGTSLVPIQRPVPAFPAPRIDESHQG